MDLAARTDTFGTISFAPDEEWFEFGPLDERRRLGIHDYAAIYATPGLYERVFMQELGMRSSAEVVALYGRVLQNLGRSPADERVLDLGAGNGVGGDELRALGVRSLVATDREQAGCDAADRDRPGLYEEYLVADLADGPLPLSGEGLTAVLALSAIGPGHIPPHGLDRALALLPPGGLYAFAVMPSLLPGSEDEGGLATGYPNYLAELLERTTELVRTSYVHRRWGDGTPHHAVALVGQV